MFSEFENQNRNGNQWFFSKLLIFFQTSYNLIHLIFSVSLNFNIATTSQERENKLVSQLGQIRQPEFLCVLNQPFNVHFTMSEPYKALSEAQKRKVLRKFLAKLTRSCFRKLWVVIIDNVQYSDDDSMLLFNTIAKHSTIFLILSVGCKLNGEYEINPIVLEKARVWILIKTVK